MCSSQNVILEEKYDIFNVNHEDEYAGGSQVREDANVDLLLDVDVGESIRVPDVGVVAPNFTKTNCVV